MHSCRIGGGGVCQPSMEPDTLGIKPGSDSGGRPNVSNTSLEGSALVCNDSINVCRLATPPSKSGAGVTCGKHVSTPTSGRTEHIRKSLKSQALSEQASSLIVKSWRVKTSQSYDSPLQAMGSMV